MTLISALDQRLLLLRDRNTSFDYLDYLWTVSVCHLGNRTHDLALHILRWKNYSLHMNSVAQKKQDFLRLEVSFFFVQNVKPDVQNNLKQFQRRTSLNGLDFCVSVYSWGDGDFGKLGRGGSEGCNVPYNIEKLNGVGICQIECGAQVRILVSLSLSLINWTQWSLFYSWS